MTYYNPIVESKAHHICHMIGVNEGIHLSDKSRYDIFSSVRAGAAYWKDEVDEVRRLNHAKKWNELKLWVNRYPEASMQDVFEIISMLEQEEYIRDHRPNCIKITS